MEHPEQQYLNLLREVKTHGSTKEDYSSKGKRTIKSVFGKQSRYDLSDETLPLLTTKKVFFKGIVHELVWFLRGETNIKYLADNNVHIWDDWPYKEYKKAIDAKTEEPLNQKEFIEKIKGLSADDPFVTKWGELGPIYGRQWRKWKAGDGREIDQLKWALWKVQKYPDRKHALVSAWNPEFIYEMSTPGTSMAIPPCHTLFHLNSSDEKLSLLLYQRSCDSFLGVPFNIASYSMLTVALAQLSGLKPGEFIHTYGDFHIYDNHFDQVEEQISRDPRPFPKFRFNPDRTSLDEIVFEDFQIEDYKSHPAIKADITVVGGFDEKDREEIQKKSDLLTRDQALRKSK
ncbi:thymidylate synthase [Candidatus Pacearchaeota archaeon]|nr:thymidylate synthase [Candidatus Pacearchaeota archaeon]